MNTIDVHFFADIRERFGKGQEFIDAEGIHCVKDVWRRVAGSCGGLPPVARVLVAVNQEYAAMDAPVRAGDEVAFFPPVTGG